MGSVVARWMKGPSLICSHLEGVTKKQEKYRGQALTMDNSLAIPETQLLSAFMACLPLVSA
jgi:hypothetical protein